MKRTLYIPLLLICLVETTALAMILVSSGANPTRLTVKETDFESPPSIPDPRAPTDRWMRWFVENRNRIYKRADEELASWIEDNGQSAGQIEGAEVHSVKRFGPWVYVQMHKGNEETRFGHLHDAFFHILLLGSSLRAVYVQRGPDMIE